MGNIVVSKPSIDRLAKKSVPPFFNPNVVASFYCVLTITRLVKSVLVLMTCVFVGTFVQSLVMLLGALAMAEDIDPTSQSFWLALLGPSLTGSLVCLIFGLLLAYYLRLLGYQLMTQHDHVHRSSDEPVCVINSNVS